MEKCILCTMPLSSPEDIGCKISEGAVCVHCTTPDGKAKSCADVFEGGVQFFLSAIPGTDRESAEKLVRRNMKSLLYWQKNGDECLNGPEATPEEFKAALAKL